MKKKTICNILSAVFFTSILYTINWKYYLENIIRKFIKKFEKNLQTIYF